MVMIMMTVIAGHFHPHWTNWLFEMCIRSLSTRSISLIDDVRIGYFSLISLYIYFANILLYSHFCFSGHSYVFSAPEQLLESMPGTLMLTDCLEACQANESCGAVNYETGLCVLFSANADKLPGK